MEEKNAARLKAEEENRRKLVHCSNRITCILMPAFQENQKKKYEQSYDRLFEGEELEPNNSDNDSDDFM